MEERQINEILEKALEKISIAATGSPFAGMATSAVAKKLPSMSYADKISINDNNFKLCEEVLTLQGSIIYSNPSENMIAAIVGSGFGNMNPAILIAKATNEAIFVRAAAKEGLIKQHTAKKAVQKFIEKIKG